MRILSLAQGKASIQVLLHQGSLLYGLQDDRIDQFLISNTLSTDWLLLCTFSKQLLSSCLGFFSFWGSKVGIVVLF